MQSYGNSIAHLSFLGKRKRGSISNVLLLHTYSLSRLRRQLPQGDAFFAAVTRGSYTLYASSFAATSSATSMTLSMS